MMQENDNQVDNPTEQEDKGSDTASHTPGTAKGEEAANSQGKETGREEGDLDDSGRPTSTRTARDSTSVNPDNQEPIDPAMPHMPPA